MRTSTGNMYYIIILLQLHPPYHHQKVQDNIAHTTLLRRACVALVDVLVDVLVVIVVDTGAVCAQCASKLPRRPTPCAVT